METTRAFDGAIAIVTGAASGIGRAVATELAKRHARVILADIQTEMAREAARAIEQSGGQAEAISLDVRNARSVTAMFDDVCARHGRLDYVFNNAGTGVFGEFHLLNDDDWQLQVDVNFTGALHVARAAYRRFVTQRFGHLVNTASLAGIIGSPFLSVYSATKHGLVGLSKSLRIEGARLGVRVSVLCPGVVRTPLLTGKRVYSISDEQILKWWTALRPITADAFATRALDAVAANRGVIVIPREAAILARLLRAFPALEEWASTKAYKETLKKFPEFSNAAPRDEVLINAREGGPEPRV